MKICYLIITCEAYIPTRVQWQRETWLRHIRPEDDYLGLTCKMHPDDRHLIGFNTADTYHSCPAKYVEFFKQYKIEGFDWIVFVDDDTFVFPKRLEALLESYDPSDPFYIGIENNHCIPYMSGGAGFAVSKTLYEHILEGHKTGKVFEPRRLDDLAGGYGDCHIGQWIYNLGIPVKRVINRLFCAQTLEKPGAPSREEALTAHYCKEEHFREYNLLLE
jgi:hypothetical protein